MFLMGEDSLGMWESFLWMVAWAAGAVQILFLAYHMCELVRIKNF